MSRSKLPDRLMDAKGQLAICLLWSLALIVFGWLSHPIEVLAAESDHYVDKAEALLQGSVPEDRLHPLLYPILTAGLGLLVGDCFVAGRIISSLGAGVFLFFSARVVGETFGRAASWVSMCMVMVNPLVIQVGVQASTDMTWAGFSSVALYLAVRASRRRDHGNAFLVGGFFALSYFTRYTTSTFLPAIAVALALPRELTGRQRIHRIALFSAGVVVWLIPHFLLTYSVFGEVLYDETWKALAWKHYGGQDPLYLWTNNDYDGWLSVVLADPAAIIGGALRDAVGSPWIPVAIQGSPPAGWVGWLLTVCLAGGVVVSVRRRNAAAMITMMALGGYVAAICLSVPPSGRHLLIIIPLCYGLIAHFVVEMMRGRRVATDVAGGMLVILVGVHTPGGISRFIERHPIEEVEAANQLVEEQGPVGLVASYLSMHRYFPYPTVHSLELAGPIRIDSADGAFERIRDTVAESGAQYVMLGRASLGEQNFFRLREVSIPEFLEVVRHDDEVLLLKVVGMGLDWIESAAATLDPESEGLVRLEIRLAPNAPANRIGVVAMIAKSPGGNATPLPLARDADGSYSTIVPRERLEAGRWSFIPGVSDSEGRLCRGEPVFLTIR